MKVTKGQPKQETRKVVAFYTGYELVFRDRHSDKNYVLSNENSVYKGSVEFDDYVESARTEPGFIPFYEGDTIVIEL